jgi:hypothetical protein
MWLASCVHNHIGSIEKVAATSVATPLEKGERSRYYIGRITPIAGFPNPAWQERTPFAPVPLPSFSGDQEGEVWEAGGVLTR